MLRLVSGVSLVIAISLSGHQRLQGQQPSPLDPAVFRGGVEVVELDVSVLDKLRQPIRGLTTANFSITEDGKLRPIVTFAAVDLARASPASAAPTAGPLTAVPAGEGRLVVVLMDRTVSIGPETQIARRIAVEAIRAMGPADLGAVIYTGPGLRSQDLTTDKARLLAAITGMVPGATSATGAEAGRSMTDRLEAELYPKDPNALPRILAAYDVSGECMCGLCVHQAITHIATELQRYPRRTKSLLFIGTDIPMETRQVQCASRTNDARNAMLRAVDLSHLTVHAFDASGLETRIMGASMSIQGKDLTSAPSARPRAMSEVDLARERQMVRHGNLSVLPSRTGGRTVLNTNTPYQAVPAIFDENSFYYVLAFEPAAKPDGKRHDIRVRVDQKDVQVSTRRHFIRPKSQE